MMEMGGALRDLMNGSCVLWCGICFHQCDFGFSRFGGSEFVACFRFVFGPFDLKWLILVDLSLYLGTSLGSCMAFSTYYCLHFILLWNTP